MSSLTANSRSKSREKTTAFLAPMTVSDSVSGTTSYTTNSLNQYTNIASQIPLYDNNGNLTNLNGWTYSYDPQNRCVSRTLTLNNQPSTTYFLYDGWQLAEELNGSGTEQALYVSGANVDELLYKATSAATVFYQHDALGSTTALTDANGNLVEHYTYDVFGTPTILNTSNLTLSASAYGNRFLFTGREYLQEVGLYDYRNRVYSADLGRFLQTDPMRFSAGDVNIYRYVGNNTIHLTDNFGLTWSVGGKVNPDANTVICQCGKPQIHIGKSSQEKSSPKIIDCIKKHEQSHVDDVNRENPDICVGKPDGSVVVNNDQRVLGQSEVRASSVEIDCLEHTKADNQEEAKELIDREKQIEDYRSENIKRAQGKPYNLSRFSLPH